MDIDPARLRSLADVATAEELERLTLAIQAELSRWEPLPHQQPPSGEWTEWWLTGGRGCGKTEGGANATNLHMLGPPCDRRVPGGHRGRIIAPTYTDAVTSCINGPSGLRTLNREVALVGTKEGTLAVWPNGATAKVYGAYSPEDPERLRSGGNACWDWKEEVAAWRQLGPMSDQARFGLRLGLDPRAVATTTPKNRPEVRDAILTGIGWPAFRLVAALTPWVEDVHPERRQRIALTHATTDDNPYLAPEVRADLYARYAGTRLGRQELEGLLVDDLGIMFSRAWFGIIDATPSGATASVRFWDLAGTEPSPSNDDPDWTAGVRVSRYDRAGVVVPMPDGSERRLAGYNVDDVRHARVGPAAVESLVLQTAKEDGPGVLVAIEQEPGQSGKAQVQHFARVLHGTARVQGYPPSGSKETRAHLHAASAEQGRVTITRGEWNRAWLDEHEEFPEGAHDDQVDATSGAFAVLEGKGREARGTLPTVIPRPTGTRPTRLAVARR